MKFAISVLALAGTGLAQDGLTIDNKHKERVSTPEAEKIYSSACSVVQREFGFRHALHPQVRLVWVPTRTRYGLQDEKSGLPNGIATLSHRESGHGPLCYGQPLRDRISPQRQAKRRPGPDEVWVRVTAAGVGPWDALIREHKSVVKATPPLILGADLSGVVEEVGPGVSTFHVGQEVYGVSDSDFCGTYTQFAIASAKMVARKPLRLSHVEAASAPVVAVTAWQMFSITRTQNRHSAYSSTAPAGNVGASVQLASQAGLQVFATGVGRPGRRPKSWRRGCRRLQDHQV